MAIPRTIMSNKIILDAVCNICLRIFLEGVPGLCRIMLMCLLLSTCVEFPGLCLKMRYRLICQSP